MKKLFVLVLGALLAISFAAPVLAETKVDFSGAFRVRYWNRNNTKALADESEDEYGQQYLTSVSPVHHLHAQRGSGGQHPHGSGQQQVGAPRKAA